MNIRKIFPVIFLSILLASCTDRDREIVKKDLDTVKTSLQKDLDTLKNIILPGDTLFNSVVTQEIVVPPNVSETIHDNLEDIFDHYVEIKDQLADNDSVDTKKHAVEMLEVLIKAANETGKKIDKNWNLEGSKILKFQKVIDSTNSLKDQRDWFGKLSVIMTEAIQKYGLPGKTIYELSSTGSGKNNYNWLTESKDSDNPYTGDDNDSASVKVVRGWEFKKN